MSYCVNCGVELDATAGVCPLCQTPVMNPRQPVDTFSPPPFPTVRKEVPPVNRWELALLLSAMLASVAVCCGILNIFLQHERVWSLYVIGAAIMLWIWFVPPLLMHGIALLLRLLLDVVAVGLYVYLVSLDLNGELWFMGLALPIILSGGGVVLFLGLVLQNGKRSILSGITIVIGAAGVVALFAELFVDQWLYGAWTPDWSPIVVKVCVALIIPLVIVRRVPSLREEARRRFHV